MSMYSGRQYTRQDGAVLLVGLIMLLVLTVVGTSSMTSVTMEERMAGNMFDSNMAFQGAEAALRNCEEYISGLDVFKEPTDDAGGNDFWVMNDPAAAASATAAHWWLDFEFWLSEGSLYDDNATDLTAAGFAENPRCIREYAGLVSDSKNIQAKLKGVGWQIYRVTSMSYGADRKSSSVLESIYMKRYK